MELARVLGLETTGAIDQLLASYVLVGEAGRRGEGAERDGEGAVHPGGREAEATPPAGVPWLQISAQEKAESELTQVFH